MTKYIYMALAGVVVVLIGALRYQSSVIDELEITTKQQENTIQQQEDANKSLSLALQQERYAIIEQQERNNEIERIATENAEYGDVVIQLVKVTAERDKCASQVDHLNKWINQAKGGK